MARTQSGLLTSSSWNRSHSIVGFVDAVDVPALSRSLQSLVDRHCALRTAYMVSGPVVQQPGEVKLILQVAELAEVAGAKWDEQYRWICFKANEPFDIQSPKTKCKALLRAVIASSARGHVLLLSAPAIAVDIWSLLVLLDDLRIIYSSSAQDAEFTLPDLEMTHLDYVAWSAYVMASTTVER